MRTSILAASILLVGGLLVTGTAAQAAPQKARTAAHKTEMTWASGTLEKFDPVSRALVVKRAGKDMTFTLGEQAGVMHGKKKGTLPELAAAIGKTVKVEYSTANGANTVSLVEISAGAERPTKGVARK